MTWKHRVIVKRRPPCNLFVPPHTYIIRAKTEKGRGKIEKKAGINNNTMYHGWLAPPYLLSVLILQFFTRVLTRT